MLKENLIQHLLSEGKTGTWVELYDQYPYKGINLTNKQKSDAVRKLNKRIQRKSMITTKNPKILNNIISTPNQEGQYLIFGCVHAPFINKNFWNSILKFANNNKYNIKGLIFNGDFLDLNALSAHDKGKMPIEGISLGYEYNEANKIIDEIESILNKNIYKAYLYGNHEDRYNRYMSYPDNKKLEGGLLNPIEALNLKKRNYNIYTDWKNDEIILGDLTIIHGEFFNVHLCKKYLDTFKTNMLFAHSHRVQVYKEGNHAAYNIGCLLDVNSPVFNYASKAMKKTWSNAFAVCNVYNNKTSVEIINWNVDHFWYGGVRY